MSLFPFMSFPSRKGFVGVFSYLWLNFQISTNVCLKIPVGMGPHVSTMLEATSVSVYLDFLGHTV